MSIKNQLDEINKIKHLYPPRFKVVAFYTIGHMHSCYEYDNMVAVMNRMDTLENSNFELYNQCEAGPTKIYVYREVN